MVVYQCAHGSDVRTSLRVSRARAHFARLPESQIESPNTTRLLMQVGQGGVAGEGGGGGSLRASGGGALVLRGGGDLAFLCGFFFASTIVEEEAARIAISKTLISDILKQIYDGIMTKV